MIESTSQFNTVYVIQSLDKGSLQTGRRLVEDALLPAARAVGIGVALYSVADRTAFFDALERVEAETAVSGKSNHVYPILHIDAHGAEDKSGIFLSPSGEIVAWKEFAHRCRRINRSCHNNLLLTAGLCYGLHAITEVTIKELTPFFAVVGPEGQVSAHEVDIFATFYNELLRSGDLNAACEKLGEKFGIYLSERLFARAYAAYVRDSATGKGRKERVERLVTGARGLGTPLSLRQIRQIAKRRSKPDKSSFEKMKDKFLLSSHPSNAGRFPLTFEDALALVGKPE